MKRLLLILTLALVPSFASAQTVIIGPASRLIWTVQAGDVPTATALTHRISVDAGTPAVMSPGVTCAASAAVTVPASQDCSILATTAAPMGTHSITISTASGTLVSANSAPYSYVTILIPIPSGVHIATTTGLFGFGVRRRIVGT